MIRIKKTYLILAVYICHSIGLIGQQEMARRNNTFALELYAQWRKQANGNIVISPFSISTALAMTYPGARNTTAEQMKQALRFHENAAQHNQDFHALLSVFNAPGSHMAIANTLWIQKGFPTEKSFTEGNTKYFNSGLKLVNFAGAPDSTRMAINEVIEAQTRQKIKNLLPQGSINLLTRLVLANAIYFKDGWATRFDSAKTKKRDFFVGPHQPVKAKFMELNGEDFLYYENDLATILQLPYQNPRFAMLVALPKGDMRAFEDSLTPSEYYAWNFAYATFKTIQLPKFKIDHEMQPMPILKQFGMTNAFQEGKADFSGISSEARLFISGIFHKAFIEVNEEGTEAAAATAVVAQVESISERPKEMTFIANKPFLFILRDQITNSIIFIGKVNNPIK